MSVLTRDQVAILRAAGRDRVFARLEVPLITGQVAASAVLVLSLMGGTVACGASLPQGPAGKVIDRDKDGKCVTSGIGKKRKTKCNTTYEITTSQDGGQTEFKVSKGNHDKCVVGSQYPRCTK